MLLAMLGMAVGTGNIWRFPRVAASNGGGAFLVAWVTFLLLWSVPLIMVEFAMGKGTRAGPVGAFVRLLGPRFAWMGAWVAFTATAIMFYYAVVMGWTIRYFWGSLTGELSGAQPGALWDSFSYSYGVLGFHALALAMAGFVVWRGVRGIEAAARVLIPTLFVLVVALAIKALTLPGASRGLDFLFGFEWSELADASIWLQALTQNAWDTGAGWGLVLTYAIYMKAREDTVLNSALLAFGNNSVSLLAGIMVLCTVFSIMPDAASEIVGAGNEGLTFIWVPQLFQQMPGGRFFMSLFFLALVFAAWTSLIAMIELATRVLVDGGASRGRALALVLIFGFALGVPSALDAGVFANQDFVWGVGLMVSGLFFAFAVIKYGVRRFRETFVNTADSDARVGVVWEWAIYFVVVQALVLIGWWIWQVKDEPQISPFGAGLMLIEWAAALAIFLAANRWLARVGTRDAARMEETPPAAIP